MKPKPPKKKAVKVKVKVTKSSPIKKKEKLQSDNAYENAFQRGFQKGKSLFNPTHAPGFFNDIEEKLARLGPPYKSSKKVSIEIDLFDIMDIKQICDWNDAKVIDSYSFDDDKISWALIIKKVKLKVYRINKNNSHSFMPSEGPREEKHCILALLDFGEKSIDGPHVAHCKEYISLGCRYFRIENPGEDKIKDMLDSIGKSPNEWEE